MEGGWPLARGDLSNTGATQAAGPIDAPELRWRHDAGVDANPSVVAGTIYLADNFGNVYALE
jgi:hypothetical protein